MLERLENNDGELSSDDDSVYEGYQAEIETLMSNLEPLVVIIIIYSPMDNDDDDSLEEDSLCDSGKF